MSISPLEYGSLGNYLPKNRGCETKLQKNSQTFMWLLKNDKILKTEKISITSLIAKDIKKNLVNLPFKHFFGPEVTLVPVPKSSFTKELWVPHNLAKELETQGLGKVKTCVKRAISIKKQSTSKEKRKPSIHVKSLELNHFEEVSDEILLIDDIITSGSTVMGVAIKLKEAYPDKNIRVFAVLRTTDKREVCKNLIFPLKGKIILNGDSTKRIP
jgi:hypothetical protein